MTAFLALLRKLVGESKWLLGISAAALFGLSWLSVYITARIEGRMRAVVGTGSGSPGRPPGFLRGLGGAAMDFSSGAIEVAWWNHPFVVLSVVLWAIARGSIAVAGEIDRGTLDLTLSRPVTRTNYLVTQVIVAGAGLFVLVAALVAGNIVGTQYNRIATPPSVVALARPALNLAALGFAIFGYTLLLSAGDVVRWRPNLFASVLTLAGFVAFAIANAPSMEDYKWIENYSVFKAYTPVEAVVKGADLAANVTALGLVGGLGIVLAGWIFAYRDLPSSGG